MITIDDKLRMFSNVVLDSAKRDYFYKYKELEDKLNKTKEDKYLEIDKTAQDYFEQAQFEAKKEAKRLLSNSLSVSRNRLLTEREILFEIIYKGVKHSIEGFIQTPEYHDYLIRQIEREIGKLKVSNMTIKVKKCDLLFVKEAFEGRSGIEISDIGDILGGFILVDNTNSIKYNNTFDVKIKENEKFIGDLIHDLLEEAGESNE